MEHFAKAALAGEVLQARARIGDRNVVAALAAEREEVREQRERLDRAPRLRGDQEQRAAALDRMLDVGDRVRIGRVEDVQEWAPLAVAEAAAQHLRCERGAAHAEQDDVLVALAGDLRGEGLERGHLGKHPLRDRQPSEPVADLRRTRRAP